MFDDKAEGKRSKRDKMVKRCSCGSAEVAGKISAGQVPGNLLARHDDRALSYF